MPVIDPAKPKLTKRDLAKIELAQGAHVDRSNGLCIMEVAAWFAGQPHSDAPECVSPVIRSFTMSWNDALPDDDRQMLKPYISRVVGTRTNAKDEQTRAWLATDWLVRECAPAFLRCAGLTEQAELLEQLDALTGLDKAVEAQPVLGRVRKDASGAGAAARDAVWAAAGANAWVTSWAAAGDAAWDAAAWAAAGVTAWDAAGDAAWAAAGDAARDAAKKGGSYNAQYQAAYAAAKPLIDEKFAGLTPGLQASALLLLERMIAVGKKAS